MKESDWKAFKDIKQRALEIYCQRVLADAQEILADEGASYHARYLRLYMLIQEKDETLAFIFKGHSRSKAELQLLQMRSEGLVTDEMLDAVTPEFRKATDPNLPWLS